MAQLMPLQLTISCFSKIQTGFTFLVPAHPGSPGQRAVKQVCVCVHTTSEWWGAGVVVCLEQGADLHMAQLMPLPLTVSCFTKIQIGFTFLVQAYLGSPAKRAVKLGCLCVCPYYLNIFYSTTVFTSFVPILFLNSINTKLLL